MPPLPPPPPTQKAIFFRSVWGCFSTPRQATCTTGTKQRTHGIWTGCFSTNTKNAFCSRETYLNVFQQYSPVRFLPLRERRASLPRGKTPIFLLGKTSLHFLRYTRGGHFVTSIIQRGLLRLLLYRKGVFRDNHQTQPHSR